MPNISSGWLSGTRSPTSTSRTATSRRLPTRTPSASCCLADRCAERGRLGTAALLKGFVERYEERLTFTVRRQIAVRRALDPVAEAHHDRWEAGRGLDTGAAVGYALSLD
jgi:hypothetical protein